jgi:general nucleoside transport system permease protein
MAGYAVAYLTGSAWAGVGAAAVAGALFGLLHGVICSLPRVNDIAIGIALMLFGSGLAFFFGKPYIQPVAPDLPSIPFGCVVGPARRFVPRSTSTSLFLIGAAAAVVLVDVPR